MADPIVVRLTSPVKGYPVGAEFGFTDATQATSVLGAGAFEVVREQDGDLLTPPTPEELEQWELDALAVARARRLILGEDFDPLWERVEGIPTAEELTQMRSDVAAVADVPAQVDALETTVAAKADASAVTAVDARVARVDPGSVGADGTAIVYTGGAPAARRLGYWDVTWSGATASPTGTAYAAMTDSSAAITSGIATAKTLGVPVVGRGTYRIDSTVTIDTDADFLGATFVAGSTALTAAVVIGNRTSGTRTTGITVRAPKVVQAGRTKGTGTWAGTDAGVVICNLFESVVHVPRVENFSEGLLLAAKGTGTTYNEIHIGTLLDNKIGLDLAADHALIGGTGGWVTENLILGGKYRIEEGAGGEGTNVPGTRLIRLIAPSGAYRPDNNVFVKPCVENNAPEYHVEIDNAYFNHFLGVRWEATGGPRLHLKDCFENIIDGGYNAYNIQVTHTGTTNNNQIRTSRWVRQASGGGAGGVLRVSNTSSDGAPALAVYPAASRVGSGDSAADVQTFIAASESGWRRAGDTDWRFKVLANTGVLSWGSGTAAPDTTLAWFGANTLSTGEDDTLRAGSGAWNGGHLRLGNYHLWVDAAGALRIKNGAPTSATDGTVVGSQS